MSNRNIIKASLFTPGSRGWGLPMLFWGAPGIGKTDIIESVAHEYGMHVEVLSPGERGEGAFGVTPVPIEVALTERTKQTLISYPMPDWIEKFEQTDDRGVLFVDELNTAAPALQPALLGLIQARRIGSHYLGAGIRSIGAANPPELSAGGWDLAAPVANRFGHMDWDAPTASDWTDWLLSSSATHQKPAVLTSAHAEEERVMKAWPEPYARAKGTVAGFIKAKSSLLHKMPEANDPKAGRSWPSHRTWDMAVRALAASEVHHLNDSERMLFVSAFVGAGAATEFIAYQKNVDLPDPAKVLDGEIKWKHDPKRLDRTMAVLASCTALVIPEKAEKRQARIEKIWEMLSDTMNDAQDIAFLSARSLNKFNLINAKAATGVLAKLRPLMQQVGMGKE